MSRDVSQSKNSKLAKTYFFQVKYYIDRFISFLKGLRSY